MDDFLAYSIMIVVPALIMLASVYIYNRWAPVSIKYFFVEKRMNFILLNISSIIIAIINLLFQKYFIKHLPDAWQNILFISSSFIIAIIEIFAIGSCWQKQKNDKGLWFLIIIQFLLGTLHLFIGIGIVWLILSPLQFNFNFKFH